jgi:hypothetical protein
MESRKKKIIKPPVLFDETQEIFSQLRKEFGYPVLAYWNSPRGSICHNDVVGFQAVLEALGKQKKLALFIKSGGGSGEASLRIVNLIRQYTDHFEVLVPLECASAGTMLALGADQILMSPMAYLTAVDTSLRHELSPLNSRNELVSVSQDELTRVVSLWQKQRDGGESKGSKGIQDKATNPYEALFQFVHPLVIGAVDRCSSLSIKLCQEILSYHLKDEKEARRIAEHLNSDYPAHSYPITLREAKKAGLKVSSLNDKTCSLLMKLNLLYSDMGRPAITDFDEENYHDNEILNIVETSGLQIFYQTDEDRHYLRDERRWVSLNDQSSWRRVERRSKRVSITTFHIR